MDKTVLDRFIKLINFDRETAEIEQRLVDYQEDIEKSKHEIDVCTTALERVQDHKKSVRKSVDENELLMKELDAQEKEKKKKLDETTNQREYQSISKEIELLRKKQHDLEKSLLEAWKRLEEVNRQMEEKKDFCKEQVGASNTIIEEKMQEVVQLKQQVKERKSQRPELEKQIDPELLDKYAAMRNKVSDPVVPVHNTHCSSCFYNIVQQDMLRLRDGKLVQCKDCFRILYYLEDETITTESPAEPSK